MSLLGNIIWFIFGGFFACLGWLVFGALLCITIIGIPFGVQAMKLGLATLAPFGKEVVEGPHTNSPLRVVFNVIWIFFFGWEIAVTHLVFAILFAITIIGLPFAKQHLKLVPLALLPFGRDLR
jgi:uncharacterized membrane protein YccF (DUF307 family)